jgi:hypothetical protein
LFGGVIMGMHFKPLQGKKQLTILLVVYWTDCGVMYFLGPIFEAM